MHQFLKKHAWFVVLFVLATLIRWFYIQDNVFPFMFDHGKDALAVLHMVIMPKLKLIGPWTSIPGLYFGPLWYYLLAPMLVFGSFNPVLFVYLMSILVLLQMYLAYRYFNLESAVIIGFSSFYSMISRSAWNPFPMTFLTLIILILLTKQLKKKKVDNFLVAGLAFASSLGFHFSSAFAVFYPVVILTILLLKKIKITFKNVLVALFSFIIPFVPQLLFEIRNNFAQTKAIQNYFLHPETGNSFNLEKIKYVLTATFGELRLVSFESLESFSKIASSIFLFFIVFATWYVVKKKKLDKKFNDLVFIAIIFLIIPIIGLMFLHFNLWYVYPLIPVVTVLLGTLINKLPKSFRVLFIVLYVVLAFTRFDYYLKQEKQLFSNHANFYPVKEKIIDYIRRDADGRSFSVYTYMPDIYDFPYQYLFLTQGLKGEELPLEFAYEPGVPNYVREKIDILNKIDEKHGRAWRGTPKVIYYIVTDTKESELLINWWGRQRYKEIINEKKFNDSLTVYTALPLVKDEVEE